MALAILCGLGFGIAGLVLGGGITDACNPLYGEIGAVFGFIFGAIFGAIVGGTGAVVQAIERSLPPEEVAADRARDVRSVVVLLVLLAILGGVLLADWIGVF